jgi:prepilin-type processing-associated H-X9-DG protein
MQSYAGDNDGRLPLCKYDPNVPPNINTAEGNHPTFALDLAQPYIKNKQIYRCPTDNRPLDGTHSYAFMFRSGGDYNSKDSPVFRHLGYSMPQEQFKRPAQLGMIMDWDYEDPNALNPLPGNVKFTDSGPKLRHNGVANVVFVDGHAGKMRADQMMQYGHIAGWSGNYVMLRHFGYCGYDFID